MFSLMSVPYDFLYFVVLEDTGFGIRAPDQLKEYLALLIERRNADV
jgi:hypothetical protein